LHLLRCADVAGCKTVETHLNQLTEPVLGCTAVICGIVHNFCDVCLNSEFNSASLHSDTNITQVAAVVLALVAGAKVKKDLPQGEPLPKM